MIYRGDYISLLMPTVIGVPEEYQVYMYSALVMMFGGVILFVVSLFDMQDLLLGASLTATGLGFIIASVMAFGFIRKKKKDINAEILISTLTRTLLLFAFAASTYFIIFSVFFMINDLEQLSTSQWINVGISTAIAAPIVVLTLVIADILTNRRRKKKKELEEENKKLRKEFEEGLDEE